MEIQEGECQLNEYINEKKNNELSQKWIFFTGRIFEKDPRLFFQTDIYARLRTLQRQGADLSLASLSAILYRLHHQQVPGIDEPEL